MGDTCGIPSVTLEGERSDWEDIYRRLDRLYELGDEPSVWAEMLRPILRRFIRAFDGDPDLTFWDHVAHRASEYCGQDDLSGWLTAFCVWDTHGNWQPRRMPSVIPTKPPPETRVSAVAPRTTAESKSALETPSASQVPRWRNIVSKLPGVRKTRKWSKDVQQANSATPMQSEVSGTGSVMAGTSLA